MLDHTKTSMGKRMLKSFLEQPLVNPAKIIDRLDAVEQLTMKPVELGELKEILGGVYDLERLMTRVMYKTATPRDLKSLSLTALKLPEIKELLKGFDSKLLQTATIKYPPLKLSQTLLRTPLLTNRLLMSRTATLSKTASTNSLTD